MPEPVVDLRGVFKEFSGRVGRLTLHGSQGYMIRVFLPEVTDGQRNPV